ncbi:MAG: hypothetical protein HY692_01350 [Cyanobacteria bacterium NC_groundwater_1444_Ag_S-0.65um_54_12]|nr:hypothetical protein [Cyanobacteria bacterium NC_groundwater_1444_Ag_S-0.65um_54_12]
MPTPGSVPFYDSQGSLTADNSNFFWDDSGDRMGIGTASPGYRLDVQGAGNFAGPVAISGNLGIRTIAPDSSLHIRGGGMQLEALANPTTAPAVTPSGTGTHSYTYYIVALDQNGNKTARSPAATTVTNCPAPPNNAVSWNAITGAASYDLLRSADGGAIELVQNVSGASHTDTSASTTSYPVPARNTTADFRIAGKLSTALRERQGLRCQGRWNDG